MTPKLVRIGSLGVGARFRKPGYANDAVFEIIGRARKTGGGAPGAKQTQMVKAIHRPTADDTQALSAKHFDTNFEVEFVSPPRKTVEAIDSRDQPTDVETIEQVAAREGQNIGEEVES